MSQASARKWRDRFQRGLRWFLMTMLFVVWVPVFKAVNAFAYPDPGGKVAEAIAILAGFTLLFGLPAFLLGFAAGKKPAREPLEEFGDASRDAGAAVRALAFNEDAIYAEISDELESGAVDKALWMRLFAQCGGDENKTKVAYIQQRANVLIAAAKEKQSKRGVGGGAVVVRGEGVGKIGKAAVSTSPRAWPWMSLVGVVALASAVIVYVLENAYRPLRDRQSVQEMLRGEDQNAREQTDQVSIEASDFQSAPENPKVLILSATIANRAAEPQNYPWLELTLTDAQGQPLARRALNPSDYLDENLAPEFAPRSTVQTSLRVDASDLAATGYRLYIFFPSREPERLRSQINAGAMKLLTKLRVVELDALPSDIQMGEPSQNAPDSIIRNVQSPVAAPAPAPSGWRSPSQQELTPIDAPNSPTSTERSDTKPWERDLGAASAGDAAKKSAIPSREELRPIDQPPVQR